MEDLYALNAVTARPSSLRQRYGTMSIRTKLTLLISGLIITAIAVIYAIATFQEKKMLVDEHNRLGTTIAEVTVERAKPFIITKDQFSIHQIFLNTLHFNNVIYLILLDSDGRVIMHNDLAEVGKTYDDNLTRIALATAAPTINEHQDFITDQYITEIIIPVEVGAIRLGALRFGYSGKQVVETISKNTRRNLIFGIIATLCGLWLAKTLTSFLLRPLQNLTAATKKIAEGDLATVVAEDRGGELGELAHAFNAMTRELQRTMVSRDYFNNILNSSGEALMVIDRDCTVTTVNQTMAKLLSQSQETLQGRKCHEIFTHSLCRTENCLVKRILAGGERIECETEISISDGRQLNVRVLATPLIESGEVTGIIESAQDITERVQTEKERQELQSQLVQAQKLESVGRLAGGVAHDFNNILMVIVGYCELAIMQLDDNNPLRDTLHQIHKATDKAASLTRQLLAFSHKQTLMMEAVNLNDVIGQMMKMLHMVIGEDVHLEVEADQPVNMIRADSNQIEQVLMNLAVNARDAMPDGGSLRIRLERTTLNPDQLAVADDVLCNPYLLMSVEDTGVGISEELMDQIFEPFFTTKPKDKGTGLGLSTVYGIVKQHKGHIFVDSTKGQGTRFRIYFPLITEEEKKPKKENELALQHGQETVLVVDDEQAIREIINKTLEPFGYHVLTADSGEQALQIATNNTKKIDLVITDIMMPGMTGWQLAKELRDAGLASKIIFMSGYNSNPEKAPKFQTAKELFLQKPLSPSRILAVIRTILDSGDVKS